MNPDIIFFSNLKTFTVYFCFELEMNNFKWSIDCNNKSMEAFELK